MLGTRQLTVLSRPCHRGSPLACSADHVAATPSKAELEAPAAEAAAPDSGHLVRAATNRAALGDGGSQAGSVGAADVAGGPKGQRRQRRPLGLVVNGTTSGGVGSKDGSSGRARSAAQAR